MVLATKLMQQTRLRPLLHRLDATILVTLPSLAADIHSCTGWPFQIRMCSAKTSGGHVGGIGH